MRTSAHTTGCGNHLFRRGRSQRPCRNVRGPGPAQSTYTFNDVAGLGGFLRDYLKSLEQGTAGSLHAAVDRPTEDCQSAGGV